MVSVSKLHRPKSRAPRVLAIYKKSAYQIYVGERRNARISKLLENGDPTVEKLYQTHKDHIRSVQEAKRSLAQLGAKAVFRYRSDTNNTDEFDLLVTLGGDGTLLWASHMVRSGFPVVAINTSPDDSIGHFCAGTKNDLAGILADALSGHLRETRLSRMRVEVDGEEVSTRVLNDVLFCHKCPAATSRYRIQLGDWYQEQKSSGIWVGPAAGSTGAQRSAGGKVLPKTSKRLQFVVRDLFKYDGSESYINRGFVKPKQELIVQSRIRAGHLYIDGPHLARDIDIGSELRMRLSDEPLTLLGFYR